jgi:putative tricarboxylic transport membrane protein
MNKGDSGGIQICRAWSKPFRKSHRNPVLGVILMPLAEAQFRRALAISQGDWTVFVTRPLSLAILLLATLALTLPFASALLARLRGKQPAAASNE